MQGSLYTTLPFQAQHRISLQQEQQRANSAEDRLRSMSSVSEERISSLESKLSELSEVIGDYERLRFQDQQSIQKLRERVLQLDMENTALARAAQSGSMGDGSKDFDHDTSMDMQTIVDEIVKLKGLLKLANEKAEKPVNIEGLWATEICNRLFSKNIYRQHSIIDKMERLL